MLKCKICGQECVNSGFSSHLRHKHKLSSQEYYDKFFERPKCCICGKEVSKFISISAGYATTCSVSCSRKKGSLVTKERYGYIPGGYGSPEFENFMLDKYGVANAQQNSEIRQRTLNTTKANLGVSYAFLTEEAKNKAKISSHSAEVREKKKQNCLKKYGVENASQLPEIKNRSRKTVLTKHINSFSEERIALSEKEIKTNSSKTEKYFYDNLKSKYSILYNASSDKYPYLCDFYIKELDLYIELNIIWTHRHHFYNEATDSETLNDLLNKDKEFYQASIYTWTVRDIEKRDCAIKNNLNYVVLWDLNQIDQFLADIETKSFKGLVDYNDL